ncbi:helix-turn-helix domain-containing protein [Sphingobacterium bambusae]|uniref:Helix-turn-helix domain-containing protein n=1 Tax=Sphingobacterium bambusae TaxID=662858 RepID=A0ABW6BE89_9SPHI|nr:helix-turn-helix domain-containing protein [Sphingobacterium bambusae]WPL48553.1 helix-turn-helix domain-containing protein [Sphingobacterium bambusae]
MENYITKDDLLEFRRLLLLDLREVLKESENVNAGLLEQEWLRSKDVRKFLNISAATIQNLRVTGKLRSQKVLGSYYYNKNDLLKLFTE